MLSCLKRNTTTVSGILQWHKCQPKGNEQYKGIILDMLYIFASQHTSLTLICVMSDRTSVPAFIMRCCSVSSRSQSYLSQPGIESTDLMHAPCFFWRRNLFSVLDTNTSAAVFALALSPEDSHVLYASGSPSLMALTSFLCRLFFFCRDSGASFATGYLVVKTSTRAKTFAYSLGNSTDQKLTFFLPLHWHLLLVPP